MKKLISMFVVSALVLLGGCMSVPPTVVYQGKTITNHSPVSMSCKKPFVLSQDCSGMSGAKRQINYEGIEARIAGSEDGSVVLIMAKPLLHTDTGAITILAEQLEKFLAEGGVKVKEVQAAADSKDVYGYFLICDGDAYTMLKAFTVE